MTDSPLPPTGDDAPIDAEFEPAPKRKPAPVKRNGPGWLTVLLLGGVSACAFLLSAASSGLIPGLKQGAKTEVLQTDIAALKANMTSTQDNHVQLQTELAVTAATLSVTETRLDQIETTLAELSAAMELLEADLRNSNDRELTEAVIDGEDVNLAPLIARIEGLEDMISNFSTGTPNADAEGPSNQTDISAFEAQLNTVRGEIDTLRDELTTLRGDLSGLIDAQDTAAQADVDAASARSAAVALSAIEAAARRGQPFQTAYRNLSQAAPDIPGTDRLAALATTGAPTLQDLREQFRPLRREALKVDADGKGGAASVLQSLFGDGVKVRREGEIDTAAELNAAETALVTGDLDAALQALSGLSPDVQAVFTDWRQDAQDRLTLEDALDTLRLAMIAKDRP